MRNPRIEAATRAHNSLFVPFVLSSIGPLGARANAFIKQVLGFVKKEGRLGMRRSHPRRASTWSTTWFPSLGGSGSPRLLRRRALPSSTGPFELTRLLLSRTRGPASPIPASHGTANTTRAMDFSFLQSRICCIYRTREREYFYCDNKRRHKTNI